MLIFVADRHDNSLLDWLSVIDLSLLLGTPHFVVDTSSLSVSLRLSLFLPMGLLTFALVAHSLPTSLHSLSLLVVSVHLNL